LKSFWGGFHKRAEALTGGSGFSGTGKGLLGGSLTFDGPLDGPISSQGPSGGGELPQTDKTLLDRERGPRDFGIGDQGPELQAESNPHIRY